MKIKHIAGILVVIMGTGVLLAHTWWCLFVSDLPGDKLMIWYLICLFPNLVLPGMAAVFLLEDI